MKLGGLLKKVLLKGNSTKLVLHFQLGAMCTNYNNPYLKEKKAAMMHEGALNLVVKAVKPKPLIG